MSSTYSSYTLCVSMRNVHCMCACMFFLLEKMHQYASFNNSFLFLFSVCFRNMFSLLFFLMF